MPVDYEDHLFLAYTANIVRRVRFPSRDAEKLIEYLTERDGPSAVQRHAEDTLSSLRTCSRTGDSGRSVEKDREAAKAWRRFVATLEKAKVATSDVSPSPWSRRVRQLGGIIGLAPQDVAILEVCLFSAESRELHALLECFSTRFEGHYGIGALRLNQTALPHALEMPPEVWRQRFTLDAPLI